MAWYPHAVEKPDFASIPAWQEATLKDLGVQVRLNTVADAETVAALNPAKVILASGAEPVRPPIPGVDLPLVKTAWQVLQGQARPRGRVVVIGGGAVGLETALHVARMGALTPEQTYYLTLFRAETPEVLDKLIAQGSHQVTVLEMLPKLGQGIGRSTRWIVFGKLKRFGVKTHTKVQVQAIEQGGVRALVEGQEQFFRAETVILAAGMRPLDKLKDDLTTRGLKVSLVGDAAGAGSVLKSIAQGYKAGLEV